MKNKFLVFLVWMLILPCLSFADNFVNLTPTPQSMNVGTGELELPQQFVVSTKGLSAEMNAEAAKQFLLEHLDSRLQELFLDPAEVGDDFDLLERGVVDSMGIMEMIAAVEDHFGIVVDFEGLDVNDMTIIGPFCRYIESSTAGGNGS